MEKDGIKQADLEFLASISNKLVFTWPDDYDPLTDEQNHQLNQIAQRLRG